MAATTTGTAMAALRADEQEILLHDDVSETVTAPLVLLAALVAVMDAELCRLAVAESETPAVGDTDVAKVVEDDCAAAGVPDAPEFDALEPDAGVLVAEVPVPVNRLSVVLVNSLEKDEKRLSKLAVLNSSVVPVKPAS